MKKMLFTNHYVNIVVGGLLVIFAFLGFFLGWFEDYLPIFVGILLILLSTKRFWFSFKKTISKNATLILVVEFILDLVFAGLMIYLQNHIDIFMGLIIYIRGVSYLLINYITTRKIDIWQYVINILYVTIGAFFLFSSIDTLDILIIFFSVLALVFGLLYLQSGVSNLVQTQKVEEAREKQQKVETKLQEEKQKSKEKIDKEKQKSDDKINKLEKEIKELKKDQKPKDTIKEDDPLLQKTVVELKVIAKERGLTNLSQLNKSQLIEAINKKK